MGINVHREVVLQMFAEAANRFGTRVDDMLARFGDDALDRSSFLTTEGMGLQVESGAVSRLVEMAEREAPDVFAAMSGELRDRLADSMVQVHRANAAIHRGVGTPTSIAEYQALADAVRGVVEVTKVGATQARPTRVVVGGGGPAGFAVANLLREAGVEVRVAFPVTQARTGSAMIDRRGWDILSRAGGHRIVANAPVDESGMYKLAGLRSIERELEKRAVGGGVRVDPEHTVVGVEQLEDGVRVRLAGPGRRSSHEVVDADWYVDATGGNSPVSRSPEFALESFEGAYGGLPSRRTFIAQTAQADRSRGIGWTAPDGSFAVNDVHEGVLTAYRGLDGVTDHVPVSAEEGAALLRALDVDPATATGTPWSFVARQTLAKAAAQGRVLIVGDGAGTVLPVKQAGVFLALTDAERAARLIVRARDATRQAAELAVERYGNEARVARMTLPEDVAQLVEADVMRRAVREAVDRSAEAADDVAEFHGTQTRNMHRLFLG